MLDIFLSWQFFFPKKHLFISLLPNCKFKIAYVWTEPKGSLSERYGRTFSNARISNISKCKHLNQKLSKFQLFEFLNVIMEHAAHSRWLRYGTLGLLYFVQGAPYGFQTACLPLILRQAGLSFTGMLSYHDSGLEYHATSN